MVRIYALALTGIVLTTACYIPDDSDDTADTAETSNDSGSPGCQDFWIGDQPEFTQSGRVTGRVVAPNGSIPAIGATIALQVDGTDVWMLSQCNGQFDLSLPAGVHDLAVLKGHYTAGETFQITAGQTTNLGDLNLDTSGVKIAVIAGIYDDIGSMVADLGIPYDRFNRPEEVLGDANLLAQYQVVFANSGTVATTTSENQYTSTHFANTRSWVEQGGTLYATDWEYPLIEGVVPEALNFSANPQNGPVGSLNAVVLDREIQTLLGGDRVDVFYNLGSWTTIQSADQAMVLVEAEVSGHPGMTPLAARMQLGTGKAIFTSFHNEKQLTNDMSGLLYEMILSL